MDTISDAINSVKASLYERISNPLLSSFVISWCIWNYKFVLVALSSSMGTVQKLDYIKTSLYPFGFFPWNTPENGWTILSLFIGPIVTTLAYLYLIFPRLGKKVFEDHKEHIRQYEEIKVNIEGKTSMSKEDIINLKSKLRTIESIHSKQLDEKDSEVNLLNRDVDKLTTNTAELRNKILSLEKEQKYNKKIKDELIELQKTNKLKDDKIELQNESIKELSKQVIHQVTQPGEVPTIAKVERKNIKPVTKDISKLDSDAILLLKILSNYGKMVHLGSIREKIDIHRLRVDNAITSLVRNKYIDTDIEGNDIKTIRRAGITKKGEKYLLDNKLI